MIRVELTRVMLDRWLKLSEFLEGIPGHQMVEADLTGLGSMRGYVAVMLPTTDDVLLFELYTNTWN